VVFGSPYSRNQSKAAIARRGTEEKSVMGSRILLADDSITIQKVVNLTFQDEGIEVVSVSNGDMAEKRLKEVNPDLVLADIFMPGKNGYELCEAIKQNPELSSVPVVLLVGAFEPFNEAEARRVQADAHLTKPFESRVLVETVRALMAKYPKPQPAPVATQPIPEAAATFPTAQAISNPPFNLDTALMGEPYPTAFNNQEFPPLHTQSSQQEAAIIAQAPLANFAEAPPYTETFPSTFETNSLEAPTFTIEQSAQTPGDFPATNHPERAEQAQDFAVTSTPPSAGFDEAPLQLDESVNLNPELVNFYEQYDKSPNQQEMTQTLGSYTAQVSAGQPTETAFDLVVDFDQVESIEEPKPDNVVKFDMDAFANPANTAEAIVHQKEIFADTTPAARKFDTNELEPKTERVASVEVNQTTSSLNISPASYQNGLSAPASLALPDSSSHSEILAADEPLGDVLTNFPPNEKVAEATGAQSPLELDDPYFATAQTETAVTPEPESLPVSEAVMPVAELSPEQTAPPEAPVQMMDTPGQEAPPQTVVQPSVAEAQTFNESASHESASSEFTSPSQAASETSDPALTPILESPSPESPAIENTLVAESLTPAEVVVEPMTEPVAPETPSPYNGLEKGPGDAMNLLAEFTPVNLEAVVPHANTVESAAQEPVFDNSVASTPASQALDEPPVSVPELPSSPQPEAVNHQGGDMSQEMIDEIVRRVVAQLSDSVVREIAWEVVPDCVERVVNNLTREGMNNKLAN
jgi:CheY-like chemotaxis protein